MAKKKIPNLIIEEVADAGNLHMLSMLEHRRNRYLVIVDNILEDELHAYVLDYAQQEGIDLNTFIKIAEGWVASGANHPLSFELSKLGYSSITQPIYKTFALAHVTRLVGRGFSIDLKTPIRIKRRRVPVIQPMIEIRPKASVRQLISD